MTTAIAVPARPGSARDARELHIACALLRLASGATIAEAAAAFDVSRRTVCYWTKLALTYDDPRIRFLRSRLGR